MSFEKCGLATSLLLTALLWAVNLVWLAHDTRPPVWDMALHQTYALGYAGSPGIGAGVSLWEKSGNYPPFVHLVIAAVFLLLHAGPHVAVLANIPATFILFWAVYGLGEELAGRTAAIWACILIAATPYLIWLSRETVLDYWLSALFAAAIVLLLRTRGFQSHRDSLLFGLVLAVGLLTKWFFAGLVALPVIYVATRHQIWKDPDRCVNFADTVIVAGIPAGFWYLPNLPRLIRYFGENAAIGAREGEPSVLSFQSLIYYLRLLEGYQLFAVLFALVCLASFFVWKKRLIRDWGFLLCCIAGGWLAMTLLRTKDPRFTMPLIGPLLVIPGAWIQSWRKTRFNGVIQGVLIACLCFQAYAANFGISWLPKSVVLVSGYQGSVRWDWNLYLQDYFGLVGKPKREDWKQDEILRELARDMRQRKAEPSLALVPDLPYFNEANFRLYAGMRGMQLQAAHLQSRNPGLASFDGYSYVLLTEHEQGMNWTTLASDALNKVVANSPGVFKLVGEHTLPTGDLARLYFIDRRK